MSERELPEGWEYARWEDILAIKNGKNQTHVASPNGQYPIFGSSGVIGYADDFLCNENSIVIGRKGTINNPIFVRQKFWNVDTAFGIECGPILFPEFLFYFCKKFDFLALDTSTTIPSLTKSNLLKIILPLPPLNEQQRIAAKIEALQTRSAKAKEALEKAQTLLEQFRQSVLAAAFRGDLTARWREEHPDAEPASAFLQRIRKERRKRWEEAELAKYAAKGKTPPKDWKKKYPEPVAVNTEGLPRLPEGWCWASTEELAARTKYSLAIGPFGSNLKVSDYRETGVPLVFVRNIRSKIFFQKMNPHVTKEKAQHLAQHAVRGGDILITKMGDPPGDVCRYPQFAADAIITADCIKLTPDTEMLLGEYCEYALASDCCQDQILSHTKGIAQQKVSLETFRTVAVPLTNLDEQHEVCNKLRYFFELLDGLTRSAKNLKMDVKKVDQSILAKAFRGGLVAQDPADEPASVLLERIAAEAALPSTADAKPQQARRGRKPKVDKPTKPAVAPVMGFPAPGREQRLLRLMEYIIYAYPGLPTKAVEERAKLATYPAVCAKLLSSNSRAFRAALQASSEDWKFSKNDVVRMGRIWESLEVNYGIQISREGLCTMQDGRTPESWPAMETLLPLFDKAYTIFSAERLKHLDIQADLDNMGVTLKIA